MPELYRAFIYILAISLPALYVAHLAMRSIVGSTELRVWWTAWLLATCALLVSGDILVYSLLIVGLSIYVHKASVAPHNLFLVLLMTAPAVSMNIGIPGLIGSLVELSPARVFSLAFLLPTAIRLLRKPRSAPLATADKLFAVFALLVIVLFARYGSLTHMMRAAAIVAIDIVLPYYVFSRILVSVVEIRKALFAVIFGTLPFALLGAFELARGWRLYNSFVDHWGIVLVQPYLFRDGMLRASATAVEPIAFGFVCMVAIGFLLANRSVIQGRLIFLGALGIAGIGLIAGLSRGPWLGTLVLFIIFAAASRRGIRNLAVAGLAGAALCVPLLFSPVGDRIIRLLPFVGTVEKSNEEYRSRLIEVSMEIVARNPLFGSAHFREAPELVEMIQGQGIVDIVNTYVAIALEFGYVGLGAFLAIFVTLGVQLIRASLRSDGDHANLLRAMAGTLVAIGLTIGTVSSVSFIPYLYWMLAGLCGALLRMPATEMAPQAGRTAAALTVLGRPALSESMRASPR